MNTPAATTRRLVFAYLRLSREEALHGESNSITTQRQMISDFCQQKGFILINIFADDGWSGGNKDALRKKRENGQYCACPPYGYRKADRDKSRLVPDEATAPVVRRIFERAAAGDSSRKIALDLNADGIIPPLKYRTFYRDEFSDKGAARASDIWNYTTVKWILKNPVYLGHTLLGKSKKVSVKSKKKFPSQKRNGQSPKTPMSRLSLNPSIKRRK